MKRDYLSRRMERWRNIIVLGEKLFKVSSCHGFLHGPRVTDLTKGVFYLTGRENKCIFLAFRTSARMHLKSGGLFFFLTFIKEIFKQMMTNVALSEVNAAWVHACQGRTPDRTALLEWPQDSPCC